MGKNFANQRLRGRVFRDQDLREADFRGADIRGADFRGAHLRGANFQGARAGLRPRWQLVATLVAGALVLLSGVLSALGGLHIGYLFTDEVTQQFTALPGVVTLLTPLILVLIIARKGLLESLGSLTFVAAIVLMLSGLGTVFIDLADFFNYADTLGAAIAVAIHTIISVVVVYPVLFAILLLTLRSIPVVLGILTLAVGCGLVPIVLRYSNWEAFAFSGGGAIAYLLMGFYIAWRAVAGDPNQQVVKHIAVVLLAKGGTRFDRADLTEANFRGATLRQTSLHRATLRYTQFHLVQYLNEAIVSGTILRDERVRSLLVSHRGSGRSFTGCDLNHTDLAYADLEDADLTGANLNGAILEGAWLERANLSQVQALGTDLRRAKLTGACVEAWNIDADTQLEDCECDFVYLAQGQRERRPGCGAFAPGDFETLFRQVVNTLDLIFQEGVDWQTLAASLHRVQLENEGASLRIQGVEHKGDGAMVVRVEAAALDRAAVEASIKEHYAIALTALEDSYRVQLEAKDAQLAVYRQTQDEFKTLANLLTHNVPGATAPVRRRLSQKRALLKFESGSFDTGFTVTLRLGLEQSPPCLECSGRLPAAALPGGYETWRSAYLESLIGRSQAVSPSQQAMGGGLRVMSLGSGRSQRGLAQQSRQNCDRAAAELQSQLNLWLNSEGFRPIKEKLLQHLDPLDEIRVMIQTDDQQLRQLPWHGWELCDRYPKAEIALSAPAYGQVFSEMSEVSQEAARIEPSLAGLGSNNKVRILAIFGSDTGLDLRADQVLLEALPQAEVMVLRSPLRQELDDQLWSQPWDILFFAGHSASDGSGQRGQIAINAQECLTMGQLRQGLRQAIAQGLQLAIFNSCDGLGLASELAELNLPQVIVMREPVADAVAQRFLRQFLRAFSGGTSLYRSVRQARESLQSLEDDFPCATGLPMICQNPAAPTLSWKQMLKG